jgi:acetylornithine deacetylase/succinyl-diaminopimelate desuccinylase-like protein
MKKMESVYRALENNFPQHVCRCRDFLRQKSVSATGEGIRETALLVRSFIEEIGGTVRFQGDPAYPIVYGTVDRNLPKTLIIYGMYDVQPADEPNWVSPPFDAEVRKVGNLGECIIARGAVNSKGALCGLFNTLRILHQTGGIPVNLKFIIEGEEEIGSLHVPDFIRDHKEELHGLGVADFDFSQDISGQVSMHLGLKGIVYMDLTCRNRFETHEAETGEEGIHGSVSAWISSPVWRLVQALATLTDKDEHILIPDFYKNVRPISTADEELLTRLAGRFDEKAFLREMKSVGFKYDMHGVDILTWCLYNPVINIDGFHSGYYGRGTKTVLPRKATAKIDIRFGPDMEPDEVVTKFKNHLNNHGFNDIEISVRDKYTWSKTDYSEPVVKKMLNTYHELGSDPEVWPMATWTAPYFAFSKLLGLPVVSGGLGHGGRQHSANEYMTVKGLLDFEKFTATFLNRLGE